MKQQPKVQIVVMRMKAWTYLDKCATPSTVMTTSNGLKVALDFNQGSQ